MRIRIFKTWQLGIILLLSVVVPASFVFAVAHQQNLVESCKGHHATRKDLFKNVRVFPPATVTSIEGNRLNYAVVEEAVELGSFDLEPNYSIVPEGFDAEHHEGCYGITYCERHLVILMIEQFDQKECKKP